MVPPGESSGGSKTRDGSTGLVGVVVAGGASSRFGGDKALAAIGGETLARRAHRLLSGVCDEVILADAGRALLPGVLSASDGPGHGPAAAILGAAALRPGRDLLVLACDLPRVPPALLERVALAPGDWVVPRVDGKLEPLCALYRPRAIAALRTQVGRGELALHRLAGTDLGGAGLADAGLVVRYLDEAELADLGDPTVLFANVNTPEDLRRVAREP